MELYRLWKQEHNILTIVCRNWWRIFYSAGNSYGAIDTAKKNICEVGRGFISARARPSMGALRVPSAAQFLWQIFFNHHTAECPIIFITLRCGARRRARPLVGIDAACERSNALSEQIRRIRSSWYVPASDSMHKRSVLARYYCNNRCTATRDAHNNQHRTARYIWYNWSDRSR